MVCIGKLGKGFNEVVQLCDVIPNKDSRGKFEWCPYLLYVLLVPLVVSQGFVFLVVSQTMSLGKIFFLY